MINQCANTKLSQLIRNWTFSLVGIMKLRCVKLDELPGASRPISGAWNTLGGQTWRNGGGHSPCGGSSRFSGPVLIELSGDMEKSHRMRTLLR